MSTWEQPCLARQHMRCVITFNAVSIMLENIPQKLDKYFPGRKKVLETIGEIQKTLTVDRLSAGAMRTLDRSCAFLTEHSWDTEWPMKRQVSRWMTLWLGMIEPLWQSATICWDHWSGKHPGWVEIFEWMKKCNEPLHERYEEEEAEGCQWYLELENLMDL